MNVDAYLARIGYEGSREPTFETLSGLQRAHMLSVPFENLDIHLGRRLVLDRETNFEKIVVRRRGGWCYELNGLFGLLLEQLGFAVTLLGSRVDDSHGAGSDLAHLLLRVDIEQPWICDVGFGEGTFAPLALAQLGDRVIPHLDGLSVVFTLQPRRLEEFQGMSDHLQSSPDSHFVRTRVAHRALPDGRVTLREHLLVEERAGERSERMLPGRDDWLAVLRERFGIVI